MLQIKMINGDSFDGNIVSKLSQNFGSIPVPPSDFLIIQNQTGHQWLINTKQIVSIYCLNQQ